MAYSVYKDALYAKERERLRLMIKSNSVLEYQSVTEKPAEETKAEESPYVPIEEVPFDKIIEAKDKI